MASFKHMTAGIMDEAFLGKPVIYLESPEDVQVVAERWFFDHKAKVEFKSADEGRGGGCSAVIARVNHARGQRIPAWGVVDRDILLQQQEWELWWEADDERLDSVNHFGKWVHVLHCWEMENYLLHPEVVGRVVHPEIGCMR